MARGYDWSSGEGIGNCAGRLGAEQLRDFSYQSLLPRPPAVDPPVARGCRYFP
jgi:hypothetical protein